MKKSRHQSLHWQNAQLYISGLCFSMIALVGDISRGDRWSHTWWGVFDGFNLRAWLIVFAAGCSGICIGAIFKLLDNLVAIYMHVVSMFVISLCSWQWFEFSLSWNFVVGLVLASLSAVAFFANRIENPVVAPLDMKNGTAGYFRVSADLDDAFNDGDAYNLKSNIVESLEYEEDAPFL